MEKILARCILAPWSAEANPSKRRVYEGMYTISELEGINADEYSIYYLPNGPETYSGGTVDGSQITRFDWCFVDMDLKDQKWVSKSEFCDKLSTFLPPPSRIVDSGNGIHAYWRLSDLDGMSYLRLQRRLCRSLVTDEAVAKIYQLMRLPGFVNVKRKDEFSLCSVIEDHPERVYTAEELSSALPPITFEDEAYCQAHYDKTYNKAPTVKVDDKLPLKFSQLLKNNKQVKEIWAGGVDDRSKADYRLGHIMFASGFTKEEAMSVLVNTGKALARAPNHRVNYASTIVDKIWTFELDPNAETLDLSDSVKNILHKSGDGLKGTRFPCWKFFDDTEHGYRLGQVIGLVAGVGVGKTAVALNMFMGFVQNNPDHVHFFVPLEQPKEEIADRWKNMCGDNTALHEKVQVLSNYADDGSYRNLSLSDIRDYIKKYERITGNKVGVVVIDHIGVLKKKGENGENQGLMDICHEMKAFAIQTNTMLIMQSQSPREKAGIGDIELNKDAAYGTVFFEAYCDYMITVWQPLKRVYKDGAPTVTAYKFCKIRHKKQGVDVIQEDTPYMIFYDPETQLMRELTQDEWTSMEFFNNQATNLRKKDKKTDLVIYSRIEDKNGATKDPEDCGRGPEPSRVHPR